MIGLGQFFAGFGCNPAITLCYSFINEQCLRKSRQYYGIGIQIFLAVGECLIGFLFLPEFSWKYIIYGGLGLSVFVFICLDYLVESPKFLIGKSKEAALTAINLIAKKNKKEPISVSELENLEANISEEDGSTMMDLFRYRSLRWKTISIGFVFMAIQVIYYGTTLNL